MVGHDGQMKTPSPFTDLERPPLSELQLRRALVRPEGLWRGIQVVASTASTNADLAAAAGQGAAEGLVLVAEEQTGGRGRLGREWVSPPRAGLTVSVLLRPQVERERWGWLTLLAGVSVARAVREVAGVEAVLKWPNDLLLGEKRRKAAGLLAEVVGEAIVLGIGVNVTTRRAELPREDATSLALEGAARPARAQVLTAILRALEEDYRDWQAVAGDVEKSGLRAAYLHLCDSLERRVTVERVGGALLAGEAIGLDAAGRLLIRRDDGEVVPVAAGDLHHLRRVSTSAH
jgi:BirA family biotin operon repressor/biotin-[acetyl-CoA-carboxylase] ligase